MRCREKIETFNRNMNRNNIAIIIFCILSIVLSLFFRYVYERPIACDELTFYAYGSNLYQGNGYSHSEFPPYVQSNFREPAYPVFIFLLFKIFGASKNVIFIAQSFLNGLIVVVTYYIANLITNNKKIALIAAFLTAISPTITGYAGFVLSETFACLFSVLLALFFLLLFKAREKKKIFIFSVLTGFFAGCLILAKMTYFFYPILIYLVLLMMPINRFFKQMAILCISVVLISILLPWFSFNNKNYGNPFFLTNRGGLALSIKAERLDWEPKDIAASFAFSFSKTLLERYFPKEYERVAEVPVEKKVFDKYASFINRGYGELASDKQLRVDALNKIKGNVFKYIILSVVDFQYMFYFEGLPLSQFTYFFKPAISGAINLFFKIYSLIVIFLFFKGVFIMLKNKDNYFLKMVFLLPVFYTFFMYSAIFAVPRFIFPAIPFIYILSSIGICEISRKRAAL